MVAAEWLHHAPSFAGKHSAAVAHVDHVADLADDHDYNGAGAALLHDLAPFVEAALKESTLCALEARADGCLRVPGKATVIYYELVQAVAQEVGARLAAVAVKYTEERALWPVLFLSVRRLANVEDD